MLSVSLRRPRKNEAANKRTIEHARRTTGKYRWKESIRKCLLHVIKVAGGNTLHKQESRIFPFEIFLLLGAYVIACAIRMRRPRRSSD